ncbi:MULTISPECIES: DUF2254 domain-containing protein [Microbacterium]|uniref:DUF2254 domain-containing protein n=1 Tax=Microbacterium marmarense TaxID=3122051 RepID=A0ABU8LRI3_9MICO
MSAAKVFLSRLARRVWFRAALFTLVAIAYALLIGWIGPLLPFSPTLDLGQGAIDSILQILATSMLAVTTFSLTAMVTAYSSAARIATPRATQLLVEDRTSQNVLSTFVGSFAYSLVGIVALSTGYYPEQSRTLLFLGTLVVVVIIIVTLLRWIAHLANFGRMSDIISRVEKAAGDTLAQYARRPALGARPLRATPPSALPVYAASPGFVTNIDLGTLERVAESASIEVHIIATAGRTANSRTPLAHVVGTLNDDTADALRDAFHVEAHRSYDQDPRLGVIALSEIGSRALSPATNDPGTAIDALAALERVFTLMAEQERDEELLYPHLWLSPVSLEDLIDDGFRPIARDGAAMIEVGLRVQKVLASLAAMSPQNYRLFRRAAASAERRGAASLNREDARALRDACRSLWR